jgi:hypothetical protein
LWPIVWRSFCRLEIQKVLEKLCWRACLSKFLSWWLCRSQYHTVLISREHGTDDLNLVLHKQKSRSRRWWAIHAINRLIRSCSIFSVDLLILIWLIDPIVFDFLFGFAYFDLIDLSDRVRSSLWICLFWSDRLCIQTKWFSIL